MRTAALRSRFARVLVVGVAMVVLGIFPRAPLDRDGQAAGLSGTDILSHFSFVSSAHAGGRRSYYRRRLLQSRLRSIRAKAQSIVRKSVPVAKPAPVRAAPVVRPAPQPSQPAPQARQPAAQSSQPTPQQGGQAASVSLAGQPNGKAANGGKPASLADVLNRPSGTVIGLAKQLMQVSKQNQAVTPRLQRRKRLRSRHKLRIRQRQRRLAARMRRKLKERKLNGRKLKDRISKPALPVGGAVVPVSKLPGAGTRVLKPAPIKKRPRRRRTIPQLLASTGRSSWRKSVIPGELLVANISPGFVNKASELGISIDRKPLFLGRGKSLTRIKFSKRRKPETVVRQLSRVVSGETLFPNHRYIRYGRASGVSRSGWQTSIPLLAHRNCGKSDCYGAAAIGWSPALAKCAQRRRIGLVDSAIDRRHPAFNRRGVRTKRLHAAAPSADAAGHGTGVLALLAGDNTSETPGLIPDADFYHVDAFFKSKDGSLTSDTLSLVKALNILKEWRAEVVNLSLVGPKDELVERALRELSDSGAVLISAAGNDGPAGGTSYPAGYDNVIAVTAVDKNSKAYAYANRGNFIDIAAPGVDIWTAMPGKQQGLQTGTSFAVPFATAIVAVMHSSLPGTDRATVLNSLKTMDLGRKGKDPIYGTGLIKAPSSCQRAPALSASAQSGRYALFNAADNGWRATSTNTATSTTSISTAGTSAAGSSTSSDAAWRQSAFSSD